VSVFETASACIRSDDHWTFSHSTFTNNTGRFIIYSGTHFSGGHQLPLINYCNFFDNTAGRDGAILYGEFAGIIVKQSCFGGQSSGGPIFGHRRITLNISEQFQILFCVFPQFPYRRSIVSLIEGNIEQTVMTSLSLSHFETSLCPISTRNL
jgi:hypothetical protein